MGICGRWEGDYSRQIRRARDRAGVGKRPATDSDARASPSPVAGRGPHAFEKKESTMKKLDSQKRAAQRGPPCCLNVASRRFSVCLRGGERRASRSSLWTIISMALKNQRRNK